MTNNCLVTKLKSVVNNENLDYLDKVHVTLTLDNNFPSTKTNVLYLEASESIAIENLNTDGAIVEMYGNYLAITKGSTNTIEILLPKYTITTMNAASTSLKIQLKEWTKFYNLMHFRSSEIVGDSLNSIPNFRNVETITLRNHAIGSTPISVFAEVPSIKTIELHYCSSLTGDLAMIKNMPNLETLTLDHTYVTDNDNTVAYLESKGVTVTYTPY